MIVEVALNLPLRQTFDYQWPEDTPSPLCGIRILVPFGPHKKSGVLVKIKETSPISNLKIVESILDDTPVFSDELLSLTRWVAEYYFCGWGEVLSCALPGGLGIKLNNTYYRVVETCSEVESLSSPELQTLVQQNPSWTSHGWKKQHPTERDQKILRKWLKQNEVELVKTLAENKTKPKVERWIRFADAPVFKKKPNPRKSTKRDKIISILHNHSEISLSELKNHVPTPSSVVNQLKKEGTIDIFEKRIYRRFLTNSLPQIQPFQILTSDQTKTFQAIKDSIKSNEHQTFLLHGVTGSGKTEVYLHSVKVALEQKKQSLVLVPEISLTPQLVDRFRSRFGDNVAILHSGMDDGERFDEWSKIIQGEAAITIGARSSVFAPLSNIGLIIVDEEHDPSYKQEESPRYHGRDLAILRGYRSKATVVLGSATPSLESWQNVLTGKFQKLSLPFRVNQNEMPEVVLINLKECIRQKGSYFFSLQLVEAIRDRLLQKEQSLLFLNRRGYASLVQCDTCENVVTCPNCSVSLIYHQNTGLLHCHQCEHTTSLPKFCPHCSEPDLKILGVGTEQIEENLKMIFPEARILRIDRDTLRSKHSLEKMLDQIRNFEVDIIIGTQLVTKGHDFPKITLVGVILADLSLNFPDFRSAERTFQLLTQVAGRAGRGNRPGLVLIQTYTPEHHSILCSQTHDFEKFQEQDLAIRKELNNAPFKNLALIIFSSPKEGRVQSLVKQFQQNLSLVKGISFYQDGPNKAPIHKLKNRYRWILLLKADHIKALHYLLHQSLHHPNPITPHAEDRIAIDINPYSFL